LDKNDDLYYVEWDVKPCSIQLNWRPIEQLVERNADECSILHWVAINHLISVHVTDRSRDQAPATRDFTWQWRTWWIRPSLSGN